MIVQLDNLNEKIEAVVGANSIVSDSVKPLPNSIIHSNQIYTGEVKNKIGKVYIKLYKSVEILKREAGCNDYLKHQGILVPEIISYGSQPIPYMITKKIIGKRLTSMDIKTRINDLAKVHVNSLMNGTKRLKGFLVEKPKSKMMFELKHNQQILKKCLGVTDEENQMMDELRVILSGKKSMLWHNCFCFNDFFINNSLVSPKGMYYYDFEKTCISSPFSDVGCVVLNFPKERKNIKSAYIKSVKQLINEKRFSVDWDCIDYMIDVKTCEKALEDAAYLADDSIKKTKGLTYCKELARDDLYKFRSIFKNLK